LSPQQKADFSHQLPRSEQYASSPKELYADGPNNYGINNNEVNILSNDQIVLEQNSGLYKFSDRNIRIGFVKKVYSILSLQLTVTAIFVILACNFLNDFVHKNR